MNIQKKSNIFKALNFLKPNKGKSIIHKNNNDNAINIHPFSINTKNLYKTISSRNQFSKSNIYNKKANGKLSSYSIKNQKSSKIYQIKKNKAPIRLNLSNESLFKTKYKSNKNIYNSINPKFKFFKFTKSVDKNFKSIDNSSRIKSSQSRCNTYSSSFKEFPNNKNNKEKKIKQNNNNIIINFFNAPINKYNEEFYFNNFENVNDINKIVKNKQIKKNIFNIYNQRNKKSNNNNNFNIDLNKNMSPIFSYFNQGSNFNINNYNGFEYQIFQNKTKKGTNIIENIKNNFNKYILKSTSNLKKNSTHTKLSGKISNNKEMNKNKKNKLNNLFKRARNFNNNINTINKNDMIKINRDYNIYSKTINTEYLTKNKNALYNSLFQKNSKKGQRNSNKSDINNIKSNKNILSFNRLNTFKSIDVEENTRKKPKILNLITEVYPIKKSTKNKFLRKSLPMNLHNHNKSNNKNNKNINTKDIHDKGIAITDKIIKYNIGQIKGNIPKEDINNNFTTKDPRYLGEYLDEILCNLYLEEKAYFEKIKYQISSDILNDYGINPETRTCLIDSLIDLQQLFKFKERTLFITVQIFDKYLTLFIIEETYPKIKEENLDLILTASLLIASKLEESFLYKLSDYLSILSEKYTINDIKIMENKIMNIINFEVVSPTILDFFEILAEKAELNTDEKNLGFFLINTILLDINLSQISGSVVAYAIITIILKKNCHYLIDIISSVNKNEDKNNFHNIDAFSLMNNKEKMNELCNLIQVFAEGILKTEYNHVNEKFNCDKNNYISKIKEHSFI